MRGHNLSILFFVLLITSCSNKTQTSKIIFNETKQGVEVLEDGQPVFYYQRALKSNSENFYNNYIHPLYNLTGDTLTEEFPADHIYHRGIYWAWHQIYVDGKSVGDGWTLTNIEQEVTNVSTEKNEQLIIDALWKSSLYENKRAFISEETKITIHPREKNYRAIDFCISLKALVPKVEIGGADNEKGYGGFCARIKNPQKLIFTSSQGEVKAQDLQVKAGSWMDFSGPFGENGQTSGLTILCHHETPNYPAPWIIRTEPSMQNVVFPGKSRVLIPTDKVLKLYYRLIIHDGNAQNIDINKLQYNYNQINYE